jgi:gamma-glutamyl hercynylcysteine S-oxide synthase
MDSTTSLNTKTGLHALLTAARKYTLAIYGHLTPAQLQVPQLAIVNPPLWELAHVAWFQEFWCPRAQPGRPPLPSRYPHFDAWYNSSVIPHAARWALPHPSYAVVLQQMGATLDDTLQALERADAGQLYPFGLAVLHECMHSEALLMTLQTLALPAPPMLERAAEGDAGSDGAAVVARDIAYAGGTFQMGAQPGVSRFVFDNEKWAHRTTVAPFAIASACVSNAEYAQFVDAGGYGRREWWSEAGWAWQAATSARHPAPWRPDGAQWRVRRNDRWEPLDAAQPVLHVNLHEAQAYCAWAKRRLPTEAEWEFAARAGGGPANYPWGDDATLLRDCALDARSGRPVAAGKGDIRLGPLAHMLGNVWEWTATPFEPYPGFAADPYVDYSAPWFANHTVLRGGSFATAACLIHNRFRNFYRPERRDMFVGFRTCAVD